jgi:hypothetical protein
MEARILLGRDRSIQALPEATWREHLARIPEHSHERLSFMTNAHHEVRYFAVREMAARQEPIEPALIAEQLRMPLAQVTRILDDLEAKLFFLVRDEDGRVIWAYPVTVTPTRHVLTFSSGERLYAAWAEDALATPFVQGQLRDRPTSVAIDTSCAHCGRPMHVDVDSTMKVSCEEGTKPLLFSPDVDWSTFEEQNIIHAYWQNSVFFWSEEHAREHRMQVQQVNGIYLTLEQVAYMTPITQGALFAFR